MHVAATRTYVCWMQQLSSQPRRCSLVCVIARPLAATHSRYSQTQRQSHATPVAHSRYVRSSSTQPRSPAERTPLLALTPSQWPHSRSGERWQRRTRPECAPTFAAQTQSGSARSPDKARSTSPVRLPPRADSSGLRSSASSRTGRGGESRCVQRARAEPALEPGGPACATSAIGPNAPWTRSDARLPVAEDASLAQGQPRAAQAPYASSVRSAAARTPHARCGATGRSRLSEEAHEAHTGHAVAASHPALGAQRQRRYLAAAFRWRDAQRGNTYHRSFQVKELVLTSSDVRAVRSARGTPQTRRRPFRVRARAAANGQSLRRKLASKSRMA
ncbi:hypothetical protein B0H15DRAFT_567931 [Mycena belliarum]|uniref:Uncharacterized protein n=1 Tax=Mycena belliarum TaxID=1033014 RepID=A0AAD6XKR8_9AGAR|nr:hypothetical protein B0H15DRAFT_567931 [Mycena belliae]